MKNWMKKIPPYGGDEPYLYFAFAEPDAGKVWKILRPLLERGCRVWYSYGSAGSAEELLRRQERSMGAALTAVYLTDAAIADKEAKSDVLVNQKNDRPILCLDPDGKDRRLAMGLREDIPHVPARGPEAEGAILRAEGFSQDMLGEPVKIGGGLVKKLTIALCLLAAALALAAFAGGWYLRSHPMEPADGVVISDSVLLAAAREAARGPLTEEAAEKITVLRLEAMPQSWEELSLLPALERISLPQSALAEGGDLPEGDYVIELRGGVA